ncbi:MAG: HI0074 family nucleotidyltransferase substrate-binding subunit [Patescibacteria group bacterium]
MNVIYKSFEKSLKRLEDMLRERKSMTVRDATVLRFQLTFELAWKSMQQFLREEKIICQSPKACLNEAFSFGLIPDDTKWMAMADDRNLVAHIYNEEMAIDVAQHIPSYMSLLRGLLAELKKRSK